MNVFLERSKIMAEENAVKEVKPNTVPKGYEEFGITTGYSPLPADGTRQFIIGPSGGGKSSFVAGTPDTLVLDFEDGVWGVIMQRAYRIVITSGQQFLKIVDKLLDDAEKGRMQFTRIAFDTIDQMAEIMATHLGKEKGCDNDDIRTWGSKGAGYNLLTTTCWGIIDKLHRAGYTWTVVGHVQEKNITVNGKDKTVVRPVLYDSFMRVVARNCDIFANIESERVQVPLFKTVRGVKVRSGTKDEVKHYMSIQSMGSALGMGTGKVRGAPNMSTKIELPHVDEKKYGWDVFAETYEEASAEYTN
jgi:hypothetical protein